MFSNSLILFFPEKYVNEFLEFLKLAKINLERFLELSSDLIRLRLFFLINSAVDLPTQYIFLFARLFLIIEFLKIILTAFLLVKIIFSKIEILDFDLKGNIFMNDFSSI